MTNKVTTVKDVLDSLNQITGGRMLTNLEELALQNNRFVVVKSSNIPGKSVMELPTVIIGKYDKPVKKIAVMMTLTESAIELANATGIDLIIAHHPVADAANSGGVPLKSYFDLYDIALIEIHEAFHGLHPGLAYLHGHTPFKVEIAYGGIPGNIVFIGTPMESVNTLGDVSKRLNEFMGLTLEEELLSVEKEVRDCLEIFEASISAVPKILLGNEDSKIGTVLHIFPHTGFSGQHLKEVKTEYPEIQTVLATISRVGEHHELVKTAKELNLNFVVGNSHAVEIYENGMPLGYAIGKLHPELEIVILKERMVSIPVYSAGNPKIRDYAHYIADNYLIKGKTDK